MDENRKTLQQWVDESSNIVFFGGAGMSTESGVPDFRSKDGLYNQCYDDRLRPSSPTAILSAIPRSSIGSTGTKCCP